LKKRKRNLVREVNDSMHGPFDVYLTYGSSDTHPYSKASYMKASYLKLGRYLPPISAHKKKWKKDAKFVFKPTKQVRRSATTQPIFFKKPPLERGQFLTTLLNRRQQ
jgi:hypothetical protein